MSQQETGPFLLLPRHNCTSPCAARAANATPNSKPAQQYAVTPPLTVTLCSRAARLCRALRQWVLKPRHWASPASPGILPALGIAACAISDARPTGPLVLTGSLQSLTLPGHAPDPDMQSSSLTGPTYEVTIRSLAPCPWLVWLVVTAQCDALPPLSLVSLDRRLPVISKTLGRVCIHVSP